LPFPISEAGAALIVLPRVRAWLLFLATCAAAHSAQLSLPAATSSPGSIVLLPLAFASQSDSVAGVQFDLQFDSVNLSVNATLGDSARGAGKSLYLWQLSPGLWRFFILGLNQAQLTDGNLVNLFVNVNAAAYLDTYPVQLLNIVAGDPSGNAVTTTETDGSIAVQGDISSAVLLQPWGVLNGASLLAGGVAPGEIVTFFGSGFSPATVLFDGTPAPILYAGIDQVNLIVPYEVQKPATQVQVMQGGQSIAQLQVPVVDASPAIFSADGSGAGPGAILNQDYSLNSPSNPAAKGSVIMIFATGFGQTNPPGLDGQITGATLPQPLLPVSVTIGGLPAQVLYAGAAPGLISGMVQVNCIVPLNSPSGFTVLIILTVGIATSQPGVTLAMQ
jgi:uncharacterized protein (TIGR03437 family)